jgi:hypothetical protein
MSEDRVRDRIAEQLMAREYALPELSVKTLGTANPEYSGRYGVPALGGEVGVSGRYWKPEAVARPEFDARLEYRRRF